MLWSPELSGRIDMVWNPGQYPRVPALGRLRGAAMPRVPAVGEGQTTATYLSWFNPQAAYRIKPIGR